jgi:hypothetical protein
MAVTIISLLGCSSDDSTSTPAAPPASQEAGLLEAIKKGLGSATSEVHQAVSPRARELQAKTEGEIEKLHQWEYHVEEFSASRSATDLRDRLAHLGEERWDCFSLVPHETDLRITCKRRPRTALSYFKCLSGF